MLITLKIFLPFFKGSGELSTLHQFTCPSSGCVWTVLEQQLQVPRAKHVAFLIDNSVFNCKQQGNSTELIFWNKSGLNARTEVDDEYVQEKATLCKIKLPWAEY